MMQPSRKLNTFSPASQIQWGIIQDGNVVLDANVFRTKMCPQFSAKGTCQYGSICQFAHSRAELRRRPEEPQPVPYGATPLMQQPPPPMQQPYLDVDPFGPGAAAPPSQPFVDPIGVVEEKRKTVLCNNFVSGRRAGMVEAS